MRKVILCAILLMFIPAVSFAGPAIHFDSEHYNAGSTKQGDIVEHTFGFTNKGDEDLIIEKVTSS